MDAGAYWRSQAMAATQECEQLCQSYRDEIEGLQRRISSLLHERSFMKAATATDVRNFCLNYQADQQRKRALTTPSAVEDVPIHTLLQFLHTYSNGLLPAPENRRKRARPQTDSEEVGLSPTVHSASPGGTVGPSTQAAPTPLSAQAQSPSRRFQRTLARHRTIGRFEDFQDRLYEQQQTQQTQGGAREGEARAGGARERAGEQPLVGGRPQPGLSAELRAELHHDPYALVGRGVSAYGGGPVLSAAPFRLPDGPLAQ